MDNKFLALPPGFRFHPTDEELVVHYLHRKVHAYPIPASIIQDISVAKHNPWDLLGGCERERYFFSLNEGRAKRVTESGCWKASGREKPVISTKCNGSVGTKKTLVFYRGKVRTDWIMHEYRLAGSKQGTMKDWVLCRVFKKQRATKHVRPASPTVSDTSCLTDTNEEEEDASST